ncbi:MAG: alpha/beta fold hydrolase [Spirulinaceae cyanobacterium RM2_2_10]|nr:alpha/beta fold hydrolase [Spirulinaceae cyanobacterium SM2_1_0]NJO19138.1 alpha/beta fold hydrolase [Spirulinaceae cyanobacterium RM2_2_10]
MPQTQSWSRRIGRQRDWLWRGWQIRYSYQRPTHPTGSPLLFVHGFGAAIEHWQHNIPVLAEQRAVYAIDLLGFGGARKAATDYSASLWAEQIHDFWATFIGEPTVLVGNSLGSLVCATAAAQYPELARSLVMLNLPDVSLRQAAIPVWARSLVASMENAFAAPPLLRLLFRLLRQRSVVRRWAQFAYAEPAAITDELVEIFALPASDRDAAIAFCALSRAARQPNFAPAMRSLLAQLSLPMLLAWGERDRMVPFSLARYYRDCNPRLTFVPLPGRGHCPHDEAPAEFNALLLDWLATEGDGVESKLAVVTRNG